MRKFKVYRRKWGAQVQKRSHITGKMEDAWHVEMVPTMTINAYSPEHALRIAKQKGEVHPIIGEANDPMAA